MSFKSRNDRVQESTQACPVLCQCSQEIFGCASHDSSLALQKQAILRKSLLEDDLLNRIVTGSRPLSARMD